mmetsp:Transcript_5881/g.8814  ORF Transcript_5881/g.8814 Transcript_5881/m.8814 type:complete len:119 (-) Transcript_5881:164-520(-)
MGLLKQMSLFALLAVLPCVASDRVHSTSGEVDDLQGVPAVIRSLGAGVVLGAITVLLLLTIVAMKCSRALSSWRVMYGPRPEFPPSGDSAMPMRLQNDVEHASPPPASYAHAEGMVLE